MMPPFNNFSQNPTKNSAREEQAETGLQHGEGANTKPSEQQQGSSAGRGSKLLEKMFTRYILTASESKG